MSNEAICGFVPIFKHFFLKFGFIPCKAEQSVQGMELQEQKEIRKNHMKQVSNSRLTGRKAAVQICS